jgi:hypothetical protein
MKMIVSNSKLTPEQRKQRKLWISELPPGSSFAVSEDAMTVLCVPEGNVVSIATCIMGANEQKFRRKVGEYHALARYFSSECTIMPFDLVRTAVDFVTGFGVLYVDESGYSLYWTIK